MSKFENYIPTSNLEFILVDDCFITSTWQLEYLLKCVAIDLTVYIQIFKACKLRGYHRSSIFAILFSRIMHQVSCSLIHVSQKFANEILRMKILQMASSPRKSWKLHPSKNLYVCGIIRGDIWACIMYVSYGHSLYFSLCRLWVIITVSQPSYRWFLESHIVLLGD